MEVLVEEGATYDKCLEKIHEKYGPNITVSRVETKKKGGLFGLFEKEIIAVTFSLYNRPFSPPIIKPPEPRAEVPVQIKTVPLKKAEQMPAKRSSPPLDDAEERLKILQMAARQSESVAEKVKPYIKQIEKTFPEENDRIQKLAETVKKLAEQINIKKEGGLEHKQIEKITEILENNDFSRKYIRFIIDKVRKELSLSELSDFDLVQKRVLDWIADSILIAEPVLNNTKGKTVVLVGPTGVGKTTTLAKLSAYYVKIVSKEAARPMNVQVITIDEYRIGAVFQMKRFCEIMNIPLAVARNAQELHKYLDLFKESADVICIDTTGRSPNDQKNILEMQECLSAIDLDNSEIYLTVSAVSKASDIKEIMNQYKGFMYSGLVITKLDETLFAGSLISTIHESRIPAVYITSGQEVPKNIQKASKYVFLKKLKGFVLEDDYIENRFCDEKPLIWR